MNSVLLLIVAAVALVGAVVGWWIASRAVGPIKTERDRIREESDDWRRKFNEAIVNLAAEAEKTKRLAGVESQLELERESAATLRSEVAAFKRGEEERERAHDEQLKQLKELEAKVEARFGELAGKAVETAHDRFLKRAKERFEASGVQNEAKLKELLQPVEATLKRYQEGLQRIEGERKDTYGELRGLLGELKKDQGQVRDETRNLVNVLRSTPKQRGKWGEQSLKNVNKVFRDQAIVINPQSIFCFSCHQRSILNIFSGTCIEVR